MTPAERDLLLAVAKTLRKCLVPEHAAYLYPYILAVEAEAAPVNSYGKTATQGVVAIADIMQRCDPTEADVCPTCKGTGQWFDHADGRCDDCNGTGKKEKK